MMPPQADWMLMCALRDSENWLFDFEGSPDETVAFETSASEMSGWYGKTGYYSSVTYSGDTSVAKIRTINKKPTNHIALWVKTGLIGDARNLPHIITVESPIVLDQAQNTVAFDYWTWGLTVQPLNTTMDKFQEYLWGTIIAEF